MAGNWGQLESQTQSWKVGLEDVSHLISLIPSFLDYYMREIDLIFFKHLISLGNGREKKGVGLFVLAALPLF